MDVSNIFDGTVASILAFILITVSLYALKRYKDKSLMGINPNKLTIFVSLLFASCVGAMVTVVLLFQGDHALTFSAVWELNAFITMWLLMFLLSILLAVALPNWLRSYDVFLSAPMSYNDDTEYKKVRGECLELIKLLKEECGYKKIYFAGQTITSNKSFNASQNAAIDDLNALKKSKRFILYMPRKIHTSAIFEAGYALRKNIPTVYFCYKSEDFPFLMKDLNDSFQKVRRYIGSDFNNIKSYIKKHGHSLFDKSI